jgi:hypothetical protein
VYKYLTQHLKTVHEKSRKEALEISALNRAVREGVEQKRKPLSCPVQGCSK